MDELDSESNRAAPHARRHFALRSTREEAKRHNELSLREITIEEISCN